MSCRVRTCLVALGGNLGDRRRTLAAALRQLREDPAVELARSSSLYETAPVGGGPQPAYLNACARFRTALGPLEILERLRDLERRHGRCRAEANAPRTLDLDLLLLGGLVLRTSTLTIPHPRMCERHFVLVPAAEIAPELVHPPSGATLRALLDALGPPQGVELCAPPEAWAAG